MSKVIIERPTVLGEGNYYDKYTGQYCAVGYLGKCITGKQGLELRNDANEIENEITKIVNCSRDDLNQLIEDNDYKKTNKERLEIFEEWCEEHDVILVDKETF